MSRRRTSLLEKALGFAVSEHKGQNDRAGMPYIAHICAVVAAVTSQEEKTVAALHDIVEDTHCDIEDIRWEFPQHIADAVDAITKRDNEPYAEYLIRVKANDLARTVKIADLLHNMDFSRLPEITDKDRERLRKYQDALDFLRATPAPQEGE